MFLYRPIVAINSFFSYLQNRWDFSPLTQTRHSVTVPVLEFLYPTTRFDEDFQRNLTSTLEFVEKQEKFCNRLKNAFRRTLYRYSDTYKHVTPIVNVCARTVAYLTERRLQTRISNTNINPTFELPARQRRNWKENGNAGGWKKRRNEERNSSSSRAAVITAAEEVAAVMEKEEVR